MFTLDVFAAGAARLLGGVSAGTVLGKPHGWAAESKDLFTLLPSFDWIHSISLRSPPNSAPVTVLSMESYAWTAQPRLQGVTVQGLTVQLGRAMCHQWTCRVMVSAGNPGRVAGKA